MCKKYGIGLFAITHRLEWLPLYDEIYYLHAGKVLAKGAHKELMKLDAYARFVSPAKEISS
jgi:ABC-type transport system involved in cytochrome bd biosynthesis fused ATPase/permease subunit